MSEAGRPDRRRRPDRAALVIALGLAVVAVIIGWSTSRMGGAAGYARIGPATVPYLVAAGLLVLSIWTAYAAWHGDFPEREPQEIGPVMWIVGGLVVQMLLLKPVGFSIATGLLFGATARAFGRGPLWFTVPVGVILSFLVWILFSKGLQLSLPAGPIERLL